MSASDVYDFEDNVASAFASALTSLGLTALTVLSPATLQKQRPHVEVFFRPGASTSPPRLALVNGQRFVSAYTGDLEVTCVTDVSTEGKQIHAAYRAGVRQAMELDVIRAAFNGGEAFDGNVSTTGSGVAVFTSTGALPADLEVDDIVTVGGASHKLFNGNFPVESLSGTNAFTYTVSSGSAFTDSSVSAGLPRTRVYTLNWCVPTGTSLTEKYSDGYEISRLGYSIEFSIQANAWALLNS